MKRTRLLLVVLVGALAILNRDSLRADSRIPLVATDNSYSMEMPALAPTNPASVSGNVVTDDGAVPAFSATARVVSRPGGGKLVLAPNGAFTYTPRPKFHGLDSFTYTVNINPTGPTSVVALTSTLFDSAGAARPAWLASVESWLGPVRLTRIYNAATDGRTAAELNAAVQGRGPTLAILRVRDQHDLSRPAEVIGAFNPRAWSACAEETDCYQYALTDAERTAFLFNFTTGVRLDERLTTNPCSTDEPDGPDCGAFQAQNNPMLAMSFGGPSAYDLLLGCNIDQECDGDLGHGGAFAQSYGGRSRTGAYWQTGGNHQSIFVSPWLDTDPAFLDFVGRCQGSCGAFSVDTLAGTPGGPLALEVYSVTPRGVDSNVATVTIDVTGNTPPVAVDDTASVREGQSVDIAVLPNDSDAEDDPLTMVVTTHPAHGTVTDNGDGTVTYTASTGTVGHDSFTYTIDDGFGGEDTATVNVDVTPERVLTMKADDQAKTYDGAPFSAFTFTPSVSPSGGCTFAGTPAFGGTAIGAINPGNNYTITVAGVTSDDCTLVFEPGTLDISKASLQVFPLDLSKVYGQTAVLSGYFMGIQGGDGVSMTATYASAGAAGTALVGTYQITVASVTDGGTGKLANYILTLETATLTVNPATLTVTPTSLPKVYGTVAALSGVISGRQNGDAITATYFSEGAPAAVAAGGYPITVVGVTGAALANYTQDLKTGTLTVNKALLTVTPANATKTYGDVAPLAGAITGQRNLDAFTATYASAGAAATSPVGTGTYPITVESVAGAALDNYTQVLKTGTLTVTKALLTVTPAATAKTYGQTATLAGTITGQLNGDAFTATYASAGAAATAAVGTGSYPITVAGVMGAALGDYTQSLKTGTLTVSKALLTVTPADTTKTYGQTATLTGAIAGQQNGDVYTATYASGGAAAAVGTGSYPITVASVAGAAQGNYTQDLKTGTLTVNKALLTVTPADVAKTYGNLATLTGAITGQQNLDVFTATYTSAGAAATAGVGTGSYPITVASVTGAKLANYTQDVKTGTLTVNLRPVTVTADPQTKSVGALDPPLTYQITGGSLATGAAFSGALTRVAGATVGTYLIQPGSLTVGPSHNLTFVPATLTIMNLRPPVAVADSYSTGKNTRLTTVAPGVLKNDTDPDGDVKIAVLVKSVTAAQGSLTLLPNGSFTFTPAKGFAGAATFTYRAVDATGLTSNTATATIDVGKKANGQGKDDDDDRDHDDNDGHRDDNDARHDRDD